MFANFFVERQCSDLHYFYYRTLWLLLKFSGMIRKVLTCNLMFCIHKIICNWDMSDTRLTAYVCQLFVERQCSDLHYFLISYFMTCAEIEWHDKKSIDLQLNLLHSEHHLQLKRVRHKVNRLCFSIFCRVPI